ncbi:MAG: AAA family ATPase [Micavibrio aeruginosavorus]|uniref:endopeptidase La n=1 Tax=Micavibrio aeruginosavorus TaxID=349221 RepID=A0A7T5R272_9BACT|nr:MAG: AAA family ATPase [Micavibrio aeruginosavorus]
MASHQKPKNRFEKDFGIALRSFVSAIRAAEHSEDFRNAFILQAEERRNGRDFHEIAMDTLIDSYVQVTYPLKPERVPLAPYRQLLEARDKRSASFQDARRHLDYKRAEHIDNLGLSYAPEFVTIFGDHPRFEVKRVMEAWAKAVECMGVCLISDRAQQVQARAQKHKARFVSLFERNYEQKTVGKLEGELSLKKDAARGPYESDDLNYLMNEAEGRNLPPAILRRFERDLTRLDKMKEGNSSYDSIIEPLYTMLDLPWDEMSPLEESITKAEQALDENHYGMDQIKRVIIEHVAVQQRTRSNKGRILCLNGEPGVGKTSIGHAIAEATGREFVRISLGGVRDETEIRGHRSTYVNAQPGRLVKALIEAGTSNPLILLDEIDKIGAGNGKDSGIEAAMLEVLDPEQNKAFRDTFLAEEVDLSNALFVCTSNNARNIMPALRDRMDLVNLPGYTQEEKFNIAGKYLVPKQMKAAALSRKDIDIKDSALRALVTDYVRDAGVRNLERMIEKICRKAVHELQAGKSDFVTVTADNVADYIDSDPRRKPILKDEVGVVRGLAVQGSTGCMLTMEALKIPSRNFAIETTGEMGQTMAESIKVVKTLLEAKAKDYKIENLDKARLHINAADDGPKTGPSAGAAFFTVALSALTDKPIRGDLAMTGKISLRGHIQAIGGVREKLEGALQAGIKTVLIPQENLDDLARVSAEIKSRLEVIPVSHIDEVIKIAFNEAKPALPATAKALAAPGERQPAPAAP